MVHTLIDKFKRHSRKATLLAIVLCSLAFSSCKEDIIMPPIPENPIEIPTEPIPDPYVPDPSLSQTLEVDGTDIHYIAELSDLDIATLEIKRGDDIIDTRTINDSHSETLEQMPKGDYTFTLSCDHGLSETDSINIHNFNPESDLSSVPDDFYERTEIELALPIPTDENPEDNTMAIPYNSVEVLEGDVEAILTGDYRVRIKPNSPGAFKLKFNFGTDEVGRGSAILEEIAENLLDVSGQLQDNESDLPQSGIIRTYDSENNFLQELPIDSSGNFSFQSDEYYPEIKLQARIMDGENPASYIRTITLNSSSDYDDLIVRAVPYTGLAENSITPEDFKTFMDSINFGRVYLGGANSVPDRLIKWNFGEFPEIPEKFNEVIIFRTNLETGDSFTQEHLTLLENILNSPEGISAFVEGRNLPYRILDSDSEIDSFDRRIVIYPDFSLTNSEGNVINGSAAPRHGGDGYVNKVKIKLRYITNHIISHEFGHAFIALNGEGDSMSSTLTVMANGANLQNPGFADIKAGKLIYEINYPAGTGRDNLLGFDWIGMN
jgi:hypothetical protein